MKFIVNKYFEKFIVEEQEEFTMGKIMTVANQKGGVGYGIIGKFQKGRSFRQ